MTGSRKFTAFLLFALHVAVYPSVQAQQPNKVPRIAYLTVAPLSANVARVEAFRQGLRELGYVDAKNIVMEWRSGEGKLNSESELVAEAVRLKVDIIVTSGPTMTRAAKQATATIPIVMTSDSDPIGSGFIVSLARSGGNITGLSALSPELSGKQLELLKEIIPKLSRVAILGNSKEPANSKTLKEIESAAGAFGIRVQPLDVLTPSDIETAFHAATKARSDALVVLASLVLSDHRATISHLSLKNRLPATYFRQEFVEAGGLMSYGTSFADLSRRAATYVDKILKGARRLIFPLSSQQSSNWSSN